jgi:hypothetical protein
MRPTKQPILDKYSGQDETLKEILAELKKESGAGINTTGRLVELAETQEKRIMDIRFFTYPADGSLATLAAGTHEFDFMAGTYKNQAGTVIQLQHDLQHEGKKALRSIYINSDKAITVQLDSGDVIYVGEEKDMQGTYQNYSKVKIVTTAVSTAFFMLNCTNPEAILTLVDKASQVSGGKKLVSGEKLDLTGGLAYFETDQAFGVTPSLSMDLVPTTTYNFKVNCLRYYLEWDGAATGYQLYLFEAAEVDDIKNRTNLLYDSGNTKLNGSHYVEVEGAGKLPICVKLDTAAKLYYQIDWTGVHGNVKGFIKVCGEAMS